MPERFPQMVQAVDRLRGALKQEQPIAIYADRDVDGLTGLAILARTLRTLGGSVHWGSPLKGRGLAHDVLQDLAAQGSKILILVDCGSGEEAELAWLAAQGIDVIIADHHRLPENRPEVFAWIHPGVMEGESEEEPSGCVMAFKLAQALWLSFLGSNDPGRMDYFLFDHLDLLSLGILADRMPLTGENRIFVWHGLRRLAQTRKVGLAALLRFFRLTPRSGPITVREATWQLIPLMNAAGRLGQPQWATQLLMTEDALTARDCIDHLIELNTRRRDEQQKSTDHFEKTVLEQCAVETDPVLVVMAEDLEPSVTGLAAQSLVQTYGRPAFLFVAQGEEVVGSARGTPEIDLYAWVEAQKELLLKFGGHHGAVGMTLRRSDYALFRERLLVMAQQGSCREGEIAPEAEARVTLREINDTWWEQLKRLEPFGPGFPSPVFEISGVQEITALTKPRTVKLVDVKVAGPGAALLAEFEKLDVQTRVLQGEGPWRVIGYPKDTRKSESNMKWMIQEVEADHG
jgi:single-stranded-DNA-specific exonuclease